MEWLCGHNRKLTKPKTRNFEHITEHHYKPVAHTHTDVKTHHHHL